MNIKTILNILSAVIGAVIPLIGQWKASRYSKIAKEGAEALRANQVLLTTLLDAMEDDKVDSVELGFIVAQAKEAVREGKEFLGSLDGLFDM